MTNGTAWPGGPPPRYPLYLLPSFSLPFKRRQVSPASPSPSSPPSENSVPPLSSSPTDSALSSSESSTYAPSRLSFASSSDDYVESIEEQQPVSPRLLKVHPDTIRCSTCSTDLAFASQIVSKGFTGRYGRAYLVSPLENDQKGGTRLGKSRSHIVADVTCNICHAKVGWKYVDAKEESQKYKVGKYILETHRTVDYRHWEDAVLSGVPEFETATAQQAKPTPDAEPIVFDSEDEDECEDIFSGTWDPVVVSKRRARKVPQPSR
ncbi:yippee zinc-binding/DNA-binding /Mis18- centromere assembly-domain-containing protein [Apiospora rasikravindrae]|uniref:Yippee zinc-binding/DNA-binding /Mis18-centromere assembly-domain-containing protein n=1 Tax=Apiospora rasikravindrae TaxID=990691 RepID=A0ABR1TES6_9PEZI